MQTSCQRAAVATALVFGLSAAVSPSASAARAEVWTDVQHNVTLPTEFFPDDVCGERASFETWTNKTQVNHLTAHGDGSFHFVDFETGVIEVDYVDPAIPDVTFKRTESFSVNLTPGGTYTETTTMRQSDGTLTIRYQYHLTVVDGEPKIEREAFMYDGCPQ